MIVSDFGVMLGQTSERLVVRGARPRLELVEGGPQLWLPLDLPPPRRTLRLVTSSGVKEPAPSLRLSKPRPGSRASASSPVQVELPLLRISEIVVASRGVTISSDLILFLRLMDELADRPGRILVVPLCEKDAEACQEVSRVP